MGVKPPAASCVGLPSLKTASASLSVGVRIITASLAGMSLVTFTSGERMSKSFLLTPISPGRGYRGIYSDSSHGAGQSMVVDSLSPLEGSTALHLGETLVGRTFLEKRLHCTSKH